MKKYPSYCCQRCGSCVGYLGKIVEFIYYKIFRLKMFKHECKSLIYNTTPPDGYFEYLRVNNLFAETDDYFLPLRPPLCNVEGKKIGLIKLNNIKHKFIKNE